MTEDGKNQRIHFSSRKLLFIASGIALTILAAFLLLRYSTVPEQETDQPTFTVTRGPLTISVTEAGTIRPREQIILKNEVEGQTVILFLIDEGTQVKKGDLLVELDASQLLDQRVNQQIQMINAEAAFINARENLSVVKSQVQADIDQAALDLEFSRQDLEQYQAGEYPKLEKEAGATITLAEETLTNAKNTYEWSQKLFAEKYISESELKKDELSWQKAKIDLELAKDELNLLQNFTYKRRMAELKSTLRQAEMALERAKRKATADIVQAEAKLRASEAEFKQQQDKFAKIEEQIKKTKIYAPMDGTVIYATSTKMSWRSSSEPLDEGQAVRERQELIYLPTTVSYNAEIKIHESSLQKIRTGLPVRILIDALPGRQLTGRVASIAPLPDATSMFMNPDLKVYNSVITVDGNGSSLRNGMSCQAEVVIAQFEDALYVPLQAVVRVGEQPTVYLAEGKRFIARPVTLGLDNNRMIQIIDGIEAGDRILMTPPLADAEKPSLRTDPAKALSETGTGAEGEQSGRQVKSPIKAPDKRPKDSGNDMIHKQVPEKNHQFKNMTPEKQGSKGEK